MIGLAIATAAAASVYLNDKNKVSKMSPTILLTGPELAADAMKLAAAEGVRIIPTTPICPRSNWKPSFVRNNPTPSSFARVN